jgi:serine/threonine-protein kinase
MDQPAIARQLQLAKLNILDYLARSLQFVLEEARIIHRDLKYENIKVRQNLSGQYFPVILDWGLVKDLAENLAGKKGLSVDGAFQGTFNYMAPEIIWAMASTPEGEIFDRKNIDHRVDIYALGVILYRMMVGKVPIEVTLENFIRIHTQKEAPEIIIPADIPPKTAALIKKMLARYPKDRPQTYAELIDLINDAKSEISGQN